MDKLTHKTTAGIDWLCRGEVADDLLARLPGLFAGGEPPRSARAITWSRKKKAIFWSGIQGDYIVKEYSYPGLLDRLRHAFGSRPAEEEITKAERIADLGIPTVVPEAVGTWRRFGLPICSYVLIRVLPGARDLEAVLGDGLPKAEARAVLTKLAALTRRAHEAGVYQYDFNPSNFLLASDGTLHLVDMGRVSFHDSITSEMAEENLARLLRAARRLNVGPGEAIRFFRAYRSVSGRLGEADRASVRRVIALWRELRVERERKIRIDCVKTGRNFYTVSCDKGKAHVAVREYGGRRISPDDVAEVLKSLDQDARTPAILGSAEELEVETIGYWSQAVEAWRVANVEYNNGGRSVRPVALVLGVDGNYLITEAGKAS